MVKHKYLFISALMTVAFACGDDGSGDGNITPDAGDTPDAADPPDAQDPPDAMPPTPSAIWIHGDPIENNLNQIVRHIHGETLPFQPAIVIPPAGGVAETGTGGDGEFGPFDVSPDGTKIAFAADIDEAARFNLYIADADGTNVVRVVDVGLDADITRVAFSPDGANIAFSADLDVDNRRDVYVVPATGMDATPTVVTPDRAPDPVLSANTFVWADASRIVINGEFTEDTFVELYIADITATPIAPLALVDRARILATGNSSQGALGPFAMTTAGRVLFKSRIDADNEFKLHVVDADGMNLEVQPGTEIRRGDNTVASIGPFGVSPDGSTLAFGADEVVGAFEIFVVPIDGSAAATRITSGTAMPSTGPSFFEPLYWSPDGTQIAFSGDYALDNKFQPYIVPAAGGGETLLAGIGDPADGNTDSSEMAWTLDGTAIYVIADHLTNNESEVYVLDPTMTGQEPQLAFDIPEGSNSDILGVRVRVAP